MSTIHILHLEDNKIDAEYVRSLLESQDIIAAIDLVDNKHDFLKRLQAERYDLILADFKLPSFDGISALLLAAKYANDVPFIFVSGSMGEDLAVDALKHGATDYVLKHHISRLTPAVERALRERDEQRMRRRAEEMQKRMVTILESTSDIVGIYDREGNTYFLNAAGRRLLDIPIEADLSKTHATAFVTEPLKETLMQRFREADVQGTSRGELEFIGRNGDVIPVSQVLIAHRDEEDGGQVQYYSAIIRDISAQKKVENDLRAAKERAEESERLKDNFIATMSHEIRTPLNVIMGYSAYVRQLLEETGDEEITECLWSIDRAGKRLMRTVENILNISALRVGTFKLSTELINLSEEVEYIYKDLYSFAEERGLGFEFEALSEPSMISADRFSLRGALMNIVENAIKFTNEGQVSLKVRNIDGNLVFECIDSGVGISQEYTDNLFKIFSQEEEGYTRSFEGLGIGLALTKQYIDLNKGTLEIESKKGLGTTVRVSFPISGISL